MSKLKPICRFIETKDDLTKFHYDCKKQILSYLNSFKYSYCSGGGFTDVVSGKQIPGPLYAYTDGKWCWDTVDIYYFNNYDMELDSGFVAMFG
ncbi:MAG: hypothetical protein Q4B51_03770 [Coriobacteriaceae bacterium]|nr:hypothetical protein [Coriobacteriaceae bacterium]